MGPPRKLVLNSTHAREGVLGVAGIAAPHRVPAGEQSIARPADRPPLTEHPERKRPGPRPSRVDHRALQCRDEEAVRLAWGEI